MQYWEAVGAMHRLEYLRRIQARNVLGNIGLHPGQPRLLQYIWDHPGCTQKEAADELDVTPASASSPSWTKKCSRAWTTARWKPSAAPAKKCSTTWPTKAAAT